MIADDRLVSGATSEPSLHPNKSSGDIVELKPCPFCGHQLSYNDASSFETDAVGKWGFVLCSCGTRSPDIRTGYEPVTYWRDRAATAWNTRTPDPDSAAEIERLGREVENHKRAAEYANDCFNESVAKLLTAESAVAAAWEEAANIAENYDVVEIDDDPRGQFQIASAIRAASGSAKTAESGNPAPTRERE